jgi:hypothetical protein
MTQAPHASFVRAMITPPNLPRRPWGWPNIRLKTLCMMCINGRLMNARARRVDTRRLGLQLDP